MDFIIENDVLKKYTGHSSVVAIPEGIKVIGPAAFSLNKEIEVVFIPQSVETIMTGAFECCFRLDSIYFYPESKLKDIHPCAFTCCISLLEIQLPEGLDTIDMFAFSDTNQLTNVGLPRSLRVIEESAFCESAVRFFSYSGSYSEWCAVEKGENWDGGRKTYTVKCAL